MTYYQHKRVFDRCFYSWLGDTNIDVCLEYENMEGFISFSQRLSVLGRTKVQEIFINEEKMWRREYFGMVYFKMSIK